MFQIDQADVSQRLARLISERRRQVKLSQEEVARVAGVSRSYYSDVERGLRNISVESLLRIAGALNMSASALLQAVEDAEAVVTPAAAPAAAFAE